MESVVLRCDGGLWENGNEYHTKAYYEFIRRNENVSIISVSHENGIFLATFYKKESNSVFYMIENKVQYEITVMEPNKKAYINRIMDM